MVSTLEQMQVPNGTGPGVWRRKRPLLAIAASVAMFYDLNILMEIKNGYAYHTVLFYITM